MGVLQGKQRVRKGRVVGTRLFSIAVPYLLLVSFYTPAFVDFGRGNMNAIESSPYNGAASPFVAPYHTGAVETPVERVVGLGPKKDVWPMVFFNRFIGNEPGVLSHSPLAESAYFRRIRGMDLFNESGALRDFYDIWRFSLSSAARLKVPGIIVDAEAYNNYSVYSLSYLASRTGKTEKELEVRLRGIGRELARITADESPDAVLWFLFTELDRPARTRGLFSDVEYRSVTYIVLGMLEEAKEKGYRFKIVSGGEVSIGYCNRNLETLKKKIELREQRFAPIKALYPNLKLGGTIAPWKDRGSRQGWMTRGDCATSEFEGIEDFAKAVGLLKQSYDYVWIYAASAAGYDPYDKGAYTVYNRAVAGQPDNQIKSK